MFTKRLQVRSYLTLFEVLSFLKRNARLFITPVLCFHSYAHFSVVRCTTEKYSQLDTVDVCCKAVSLGIAHDGLGIGFGI